MRHSLQRILTRIWPSHLLPMVLGISICLKQFILELLATKEQALKMLERFIQLETIIKGIRTRQKATKRDKQKSNYPLVQVTKSLTVSHVHKWVFEIFILLFGHVGSRPGHKGLMGSCICKWVFKPLTYFLGVWVPILKP